MGQSLKKYKALANELGLIFQSVHAPFVNAAKMWNSGTEADAAVQELLCCVRDCAEAGVPLLAVHPFIGRFNEKDTPSESGVENFRRVVEEAKNHNIKIAFENVEGEGYLKALMDVFRS